MHDLPLLITKVLANPKSSATFAAGDIVGLLGDAAQVAAAEQMIVPPARSGRAESPAQG